MVPDSLVYFYIGVFPTRNHQFSTSPECSWLRSLAPSHAFWAYIGTGYQRQRPTGSDLLSATSSPSRSHVELELRLLLHVELELWLQNL